ncbi:MAG: DJ-1/PfpI family protein [Proteobacteria bacterium]|nr:DJ-1/PfpI family protein [Pseudomonadota bacterium]
MAEDPKTIRIAMVLFPNLTLLDLVGPYEVLNAPPMTQVDLLWHTLDPITANGGLKITPSSTFESYEGSPDVVFIPGGPGQLDCMEDEVLLDFIARTGSTAEYVTAVCTGSLILGAAGLLKGKRATTHWMSMDQLPMLGAIPVEARVVEDNKTVTGGGVTAGIDFGFTLLARLFGEDVAKRIQLRLEYDPQPPFESGSPGKAGPEATQALLGFAADLLDKRRTIAKRIGKEKLGL